MHTGLWWKFYKERNHKDLDVGGDTIKMNLRKIGY